MPLITITGTPCSGKTYRACQIQQEFESRIRTTPGETKRSVVYIPSHHAFLDPLAGKSESYHCPEQAENPRDQIYDLARLEKTARAEEFSAIKRLIDQNTIVIADAPNYIKGFRYQLFCEAKAAGTRSVVVHTAASEDECRSWNNARLSTWNWQIEDAEQSEQSTALLSLGTESSLRVGKDVLGELEPESHTALYGDRTTFNPSRSRSSSLGSPNSDGEHAAAARRHQTDDTMTLKSLYITDNNPSAPTSSETTTTHHDTQPPATSPAPYDLPSTNPPLPNSSLPYSPKTFKSLFMRYEPPSPFTRWDTPLFTIPSSDPHPPYDEIWAALFPKPTSKKAQTQLHGREQNNRSATSQRPDARVDEEEAKMKMKMQVKPHAATILPTASAPNALQVLESTTGEVAKLVLAAARAAGAADGDGGEITISLSNPAHSNEVEQELEQEQDLELELSIPEGVSLSQPALQRLRRKYTQIQKGGIAHGQGYTQGRRNVAEGFVRFLEAEWEVSQ